MGFVGKMTYSWDVSDSEIPKGYRDASGFFCFQRVVKAEFGVGWIIFTLIDTGMKQVVEAGSEKVWDVPRDFVRAQVTVYNGFRDNVLVNGIASGNITGGTAEYFVGRLLWDEVLSKEESDFRQWLPNYLDFVKRSEEVDET